MNFEDYEKAREFIAAKATALLHHEKKSYAWIGLPLKNYSVLNTQNGAFYAVSTNVFQEVLQHGLVNAQRTFPENFGNGNARSVLHALEKTLNIPGGIQRAIRFIKFENFCWIVENKGDVATDRILRIDLFRKLNKIRNQRKKYEFIGGVLHAFKHFSFKGVPLSTGNEKNDLFSPWNIIWVIAHAFFNNPGKFEADGVTYISDYTIGDKYCLRFVFYHEQTTSVYFLKTIYRIKN